MTRVVLDVLREAGGGPLTPDEIAAAVIRRQRMEDTAGARALVAEGAYGMLRRSELVEAVEPGLEMPGWIAARRLLD